MVEGHETDMSKNLPYLILTHFYSAKFVAHISNSKTRRNKLSIGTEMCKTVRYAIQTGHYGQYNINEPFHITAVWCDVSGDHAWTSKSSGLRSPRIVTVVEGNQRASVKQVDQI